MFASVFPAVYHSFFSDNSNAKSVCDSSNSSVCDLGRVSRYRCNRVSPRIHRRYTKHSLVSNTRNTNCRCSQHSFVARRVGHVYFRPHSGVYSDQSPVGPGWRAAEHLDRMRYVLLHSRTDVLKFAQSVHEWSTVPSKNGWDGGPKGVRAKY